MILSRKIKCYLVMVLLLFGAKPIIAMGDYMKKAIEIEFLQQEMDISEILKLQKSMALSKTPKLLSTYPTATCFQVNIDAYLLVQDLKQRKNTYGCIFSDQVAMNTALLRAGLFIHTNMGMTTDDVLFNSKLMTTVAGHDFNGKELIKYIQNVTIPEDSAATHLQYKAIEHVFSEEVIHPIVKNNKENFIFFSIINTKMFKENFSHELLHAQYYSAPQMQRILLEIWKNKVSPIHKNIIINSLRNGGYDIEQQELLLREFYSYFLQYNSTEYLKNLKVLKNMSMLSSIYAPIIKQSLETAGIKIITIE